MNGRFGMVPEAAIRDRRLSPRDFLVLCALCMFRDKHTSVARPSREKLAELTGIHVSHITSVTARLARLGWLHKSGNGGRNARAHYIIFDVPQTYAETAQVSGGKTYAETEQVSCQQTYAETAQVSETYAETAQKPTPKQHETYAKTAQGIKQTKEQTTEQTRGTRAREARAAPPPPTNEVFQVSGVEARMAQGTTPAPVAMPAVPAPLHPAEQQRRIAEALAADAAKRHPLCPPEVLPDVFDDWLALRKAKHAPVNATVLRLARVEADKAGVSLNAFFEEWCLRGSAAMKGEWLIADRQQAERAGKTFREIDEENETRKWELMTGRKRGEAKVIDLSDTDYWKRRQKEWEAEQRQKALARKQLREQQRREGAR